MNVYAQKIASDLHRQGSFGNILNYKKNQYGDNTKVIPRYYSLIGVCCKLYYWFGYSAFGWFTITLN